MEGVTEGRIVHVVLPDGPSAGEHRPAVIVKVWNQQGYVNLQVFVDGSNDGFDENVVWMTSLEYSEEKKPRTWHWIEPA